MPEMPPSPGAAPQGQAKPQQPPFGASPATGPTQNKGYEAAALQRLGVVVKQLEQLLPMAGASSELGKDVLDALRKLTKHVPSGSVTPAAEKGQLERTMMANTQNNQQMQALRQSQQPPAQAQAA